MKSKLFQIEYYTSSVMARRFAIKTPIRYIDYLIEMYKRIRFFRKIRKSLLNTGNTKSYNLSGKNKRNYLIQQ
tara:strand:- start:237 stop:455 length:219 start_codon:yes stop_codon:yes gene_type:complete